MTLDLLTPLLDYGLTVIETPGWRTAARPGLFAPVGTVAHHTAAGGRLGPTASLGSLIHGRADLAGRLCNGYVDRLARCHLISAGRANHGGPGYYGTLDRILAGTKVEYPVAPGVDNGVDGNRWYLGVEVENDGVGEPYPAGQVETLVTMLAAWTDAFGWRPAGNVHHRQHSRRKIDMSLQIDLPRWVAIRVWTQHVPTPPGPEPLPTVAAPWRYDNVNIIQHPLNVRLDQKGNGYGDVRCPVEAVIGAPRLVGSLALYDVSPSLRWETYGKDGVTRLEVQGGEPGGAVGFVVSAVAG